MKIRIFTLAKELDMDSKLLIEYCQKLGIILKNSALASISPEEKEQVLAFIKQGPHAGEGGGKSEPLSPVREAPRPVVGKVPQIKAVAPRPQGVRGSQQGREFDQSDDEAESLAHQPHAGSHAQSNVARNRGREPHRDHLG